MSNNIKPPADLFDLSKLSESSLRKYLVISISKIELLSH